jgi:hypothetical protein
MALFKRGHRKLAGRKKGTRNQATREIKAFCRAITLENPEYRQNLVKRLQTGTCHPSVEVAILHYGYGKPVERHEVRDLRPILIKGPGLDES